MRHVTAALVQMWTCADGGLIDIGRHGHVMVWQPLSSILARDDINSRRGFAMVSGCRLPDRLPWRCVDYRIHVETGCK
jgi:hypothetical protein